MITSRGAHTMREPGRLPLDPSGDGRDTLSAAWRNLGAPDCLYAGTMKGHHTETSFAAMEARGLWEAEEKTGEGGCPGKGRLPGSRPSSFCGFRLPAENGTRAFPAGFPGFVQPLPDGPAA